MYREIRPYANSIWDDNNNNNNMLEVPALSRASIASAFIEPTTRRVLTVPRRDDSVVICYMRHRNYVINIIFSTRIYEKTVFFSPRSLIPTR